MSHILKTVEFSKLRQAYMTVKVFLEDRSLCEVSSLHTKVGDDLGMAGDDIEELLARFVKEFGLSWGSFDFEKHFYSEGELFGSGAALYNMVAFFINLILTVVEILSFRRIKIEDKLEWSKPINREVADLTFKQMLTWYIEGEYKEADSLSYRLAVDR